MFAGWGCRVKTKASDNGNTWKGTGNPPPKDGDKEYDFYLKEEEEEEELYVSTCLWKWYGNMVR